MYQLIKYGEAVQGTFQDYLSTGFDAFLTSQRDAQKRMREWVEGAGPKQPGPASEPTASPNDSLRSELEELKRKVAEMENRRKPRKK